LILTIGPASVERKLLPELKCHDVGKKLSLHGARSEICSGPFF
jgi:hypothetical protein